MAKKSNKTTRASQTKKKTSQKPGTKKNVKKEMKKNTEKRSLFLRQNKAGESSWHGNGGMSLRSDISLILSLALMIIMTISNFGVCGPVGNGMSSFFFGIFGCVQYVMPLALFTGVMILIANDYNFLSIKKCAAGFVLLMMISAFAQILYRADNISITDLLSLAIKNHATGGIIGGSFGLCMKAWFGTAGAIIIIFFIMVFSAIVLTQRSLAEFFKILLFKIKSMLEENRNRREEARKAMEEEMAAAEEDEQMEEETEEDLEEESEEEQSAFSQWKNKMKRRKQTEHSEEQPVNEDEEEEAQEDSFEDININMPAFAKAAEDSKGTVQELEENVYPLSEDDKNNITNIPEEETEPVVHEQDGEAVEVLEAQETGDEFTEATPEQAQQMLDVAPIPEEKKKKDTSVKTKKVKKAKKKDYIFPPLSLLESAEQVLPAEYEKSLKETARLLQQTLASFGVNVKITDISCGPTVTRYEMFPEQGTRVSKIANLADDIKLNLAAADIRIEAPIPGKAAIGIEVPNSESVTVHFKDIIDNKTFKNYKSKLAFAVGKDIGGKTIVTDIAKMPHLLIAGATGSGKSVCINTLIMSILYKASPHDVKMIMIDPKMVELSVYNGIPHLLIPVVTDPKKASGALNWAVAEMSARYQKFAEYQVRNISGYNQKITDLEKMGEIEKDSVERMPQIVIIIDELADLMMVSPGEVEDAIVRLSQLARAAGIHLVIATQRPSVNVITGLIKANVPSRIAFSVASNVDSRTIIDMNGAEKLLGKGDMLFYPSGYQKPVRVQGAFVSDEEVMKVVDFLKNNEDVAVYDTKVTEKIEKNLQTKAVSSDRDEYFEAAARFCIEKDKATIGMLQRMFKIGFNRAARIVDQLADAGIVGPEEGTKPRKVLMSEEQLEQYFEEYL